jgi:pimeloyl-ACP methyl ester carboxylesterase
MWSVHSRRTLPIEPFGVTVRPRCPRRNPDHLDALGGEHRIERRGELGVAVTDQEPERARPVVEVNDQVTGLLGGPFTVPPCELRLRMPKPPIHPIKAPTLVVWGQRDAYLGQELAEPEHDDVPGLEHVERLPDASHWVHHDDAERVNQLLTNFFAPAQSR